MTGDDPFDTAGRRAAVLAAWAASPTRFREDANAEEDLVLGGYADRLLVELLSNAADAAAQAGRAGEVRIRLADAVLSVCNTGAPLSAAGVDALTSLRASAKRGDAPAVGRFGVGFAAVLAVSDAPELRSRHGGIRFSAAGTAAALVADPASAAEAGRRDGRVPVLRLAWPAPQPPPEPYDTEVRLPLTDEAVAAVRDALAAFDPAVLLALPALSTVDIDGRVVRRTADGPDVMMTDGDAETRWRLATAGGGLAPGLLADRPVEERERPVWSMLAAVPVDDTGAPVPLRAAQVLHAPTVSDEPLDLPVRLVGTFPLDPARRRVPPGPLAEHLAERAGAVLADLCAGLAGTPGVLPLLGGPGLTAGHWSAVIRASLLEHLRDRPCLGAGRIPPARAVAVPDPLVGPLSGVVDGVLPAGWWRPDRAALLAELGVSAPAVSDLVEAVSGVDRPASWWRSLYAGFDAAGADDPLVREALAALPVPLSDGRTVTGPAGVLLPDDDLPAAPVTALGLRVADPEAVHPLLNRLGATPATPRGVLADPRVAAAVAGSLDDAEGWRDTADAVLALVAAAGVAPGEEPWLAELALPGRPLDEPDAEEPFPAGELLLPGSRLAGVLEPDAPFGTVDEGVLAAHGRQALLAVGVLEGFAVLDETDVDPVDVDEEDLPDGAAWVAALRLPPGARIERLRAVPDVDLVRPDRWPDALALLAADHRDVLTDDCVIVLPNGTRTRAPGPTRWWLGRHPVLDGHRPAELRLPGESELAGLYAPATVDPELAVLLGVRRDLPDLLAAAQADPAVAADLLDRLADPDRTVEPALLAVLYPRLAAAVGTAVPPPHAVRVAPDTVVPADRAVVLDRPWLLDRLGDRHPVAGGTDPVAVADLLDLPLLSELDPPAGR